MTYQHQGERFIEPIRGKDYNKEHKNIIIKRFFMLDFQCSSCGKSNRLKQLKVDPIEHFRCPGCGSSSFEVRKKRVGETSVREKDTVIIVEKKVTIGRRIK